MNFLAMKVNSNLSIMARRTAAQLREARSVGAPYVRRLENQLTYLVHSRCRFKHFMRENPAASMEETEVALCLFDIPEDTFVLSGKLRQLAANTFDAPMFFGVFETDEALKAVLSELETKR